LRYFVIFLVVALECQAFLSLLIPGEQILAAGISAVEAFVHALESRYS
jgi:membrane protein DedA with SNARE-associated domain